MHCSITILLFLSIAVDGRDYIGFTETVLRFEPDETRMDLVVSVLEDSVVESTEQFSIVLLPGDDESGVRFPEGQSSTINILDNDDGKYIFHLCPCICA